MAHSLEIESISSSLAPMTTNSGNSFGSISGVSLSVEPNDSTLVNIAARECGNVLVGPLQFLLQEALFYDETRISLI
ncbi:hypothetical protein ACLOJK_021926 [Asimina triloba]